MITIKNHGTKPNSWWRKFSFRKHWTFKKVETTNFSFLFLCLHIGLPPFLANFRKSRPLNFNREPCWFYDSLGWIKIIKAKQMCFITTWTDIVASVISLKNAHIYFLTRISLPVISYISTFQTTRWRACKLARVFNILAYFRIHYIPAHLYKGLKKEHFVM